MKTLVRLALAVAISATAARAAVVVAPVRVDETRSSVIQDDGISRGQSPELKLLLTVSGPEAEAAVKYGDLVLEEAVDDTGASLIPKSGGFNDPKKFREYDNAFFRKNPFGDRKPAAPEIEVVLGLPKRSATKIARLRGTVSLTTAGKVTPVEVGGLKTPGQKRLDIPAAANVTITATVEAGNNVQSIGIETSGDEGAIESITVVDASGKEISGGMSSWSMMNGPVHKSLSVTKPLDDSMKLVAKIAVDRQITKVPIDLKDLALP